MPQTLKDVMTPNPIALSSSSSVFDAARSMKESDIGDVIVLDNDQVCGIVTDRDITLRVVAEGKDPSSTLLGDCCSQNLITLDPNSSVDEAVKLMRDNAIRRLPVVESGKPVGIVSLGDLAIQKDPKSVLADISEAAPSE
ncbi:MAG TPA: CBS domain-containing protein [Actinomycetota bacterium]|nr:CBS domain-containing protein [Actinomycetota bacterium]